MKEWEPIIAEEAAAEVGHAVAYGAVAGRKAVLNAVVGGAVVVAANVKECSEIRWEGSAANGAFLFLIPTAADYP